MQKKPENWVDYREVKSSVSIAQILDHYNLTEKLTTKGDSLHGVCPFHGSGKNQNQFHVSLAKNAFNCFGCDAHGNIIDFVAQMECVEFRLAALKIQEWFLTGSESTEPDRPELVKNQLAKEKKEAPAPAEKEAPTEAKQEVINPPLTFALKLDQTHVYLKQRGLTAEAIKEFALGFCSGGIMKGRIAIPVHNEKSELVAYVGRAVDAETEEEGKYKFPSGFQKSYVVYNLHRAIQHAQQGLILVEGFFDALAIWQAGFKNVCALMGSKMSEYQEDLILSTTDKVILMFDADQTGWECTEDVLKRLAPKIYIKIAQLPPDKFQPDELTPEEVQEILG